MTRTTLLAVLLAGCTYPTATQTTGGHPPEYLYSPGVEVPTTPEAVACKRQCMPLAQRCDNMDRVTSASILVDVGPYSRKFGCAGVLTDCLLTCPGAKLVAEPKLEPWSPP